MMTLGCPKNRVDSEVMLGTLKQRGYSLVQDPAAAQVIVVNTCAFIGPAKQESVDSILEMAELKKSGTCSTLVVTGCLSQRYGAELAKEMPEVDHFLGTSAYAQIGDLLAAEASPRQVIPDPDYIHDAQTPRENSMPVLHGVPEDLRGLRQRVRLLHHPHAARWPALAPHRGHRRRGPAARRAGRAGAEPGGAGPDGLRARPAGQAEAA